MSTAKRTIACPKCGAENLSWRGHCQICGKALHEDKEISENNSRGRPRGRGDLWRAALITGIIGPVVFSGIAAFGVSQYLEVWPFLLMAVVLWTGVALAWKRQLIAGITQIVAGVALPFVFYTVALAIDPAGHLGAALGLIIVFFFCSLPFLISGILFLIVWRKKRRQQDTVNQG